LRDRVIPLRKSDLIDGLLARGQFDEAAQASFRQLARMLGAVFHYQYLEELERLREAYFHFDPELGPRACGPADDLEAAYRSLSEEFVRVLTDANFVEIAHDEITRAFAERARVRVKIRAPVEDYRCVRMFRRGHHSETIEIPFWFGLRRRPLEVVVYDDVVLMVATRPEATASGDSRKARGRAGRGGPKVRDGAVLFKYFRHIARADLKALFPNVRVMMSLFDNLTLGVGALVGGDRAGQRHHIGCRGLVRDDGLHRDRRYRPLRTARGIAGLLASQQREGSDRNDEEECSITRAHGGPSLRCTNLAS